MERHVGRWQEIRHTAAWFQVSPPEPSASAEEISAAERRLGRALPPLLSAMLQQSRGWSWRGPDEDVVWMAPEELALGARDGEQGIEWEIDEAGPGVEAVYDVPERLTFAYSDARVFQIDLAPAEGGAVGQIVAYDPEEGRIDVVAASLDDFLAEGLRCLQEVEVDGDADPAVSSSASHADAGAPSGAEVLADAKRLTDLFAAMDAATDPAALRDLLASMGGGATVAGPGGDDDEEHEDDDELEPLPKDPAQAAAIGRAAAAFVAAVEKASPMLRKRLKAPLSEAKARALLEEERSTGVVPETLLPLFAAFDGQKGDAPLLPCPDGRCAGLCWKPLKLVCSAHGNESGLEYLQGDLRYPPVPGLRDVFWHPRWLPLLGTPLSESSVQAVVFVDFDPAEGGQVGQVVLKSVRWANGRGYHDGQRRILAGSLAEWLEQLAAGILTGALVAGDTGFQRKG
jgi:cell wall assembly regulator SMI1